MAHDTHHDHGHAPAKSDQPRISFFSSFWLIIILVGLFIAALNFIQAESGGEDGHHAATPAHVNDEHGKSIMQSQAGHTGPESDVKHAAPGAHEDATTADTAAQHGGTTGH